MTARNLMNSDSSKTAPHAPAMSPATRYASPRDVLTDSALGPVEKLRLLTEWEEDIRLALVAAEEGMDGADDVQLREVLSAKRLLTPDATRAESPSKA